MKNILLAFYLFSIHTASFGQTPDTLGSGYLDYEKPRDFTIVDITVIGCKISANHLSGQYFRTCHW